MAIPKEKNDVKILRLVDYKNKQKKLNKTSESNSNRKQGLELEDIRELLNEFIDSKLIQESDRGVVKNENVDITKTNDCCEGCEELKIIKKKMEFQVPTISIVYLVVFSMLLSFFILSFALSIKGIINIINPFISFVSIIGSIGLLVTVVTSIYDWKEFLKNE